MPAGRRADAVTCSKSCRQADHRARIRRAELEADAAPLRLAYADPPYPGQSGIYRGHPDYAGEVDHRALVSQLAGFDGWALSTSAAALAMVLGLAAELEPREVRVAAWIRGAVPHPTARIRTGWEPLLVVPARRLAGPAVVDVLTATPRPRPTLPSAVVGMKPPVFCEWMFGLLGALPGDSLADLFPGSGIVARAWRQYAGESEVDVGEGQLALTLLAAN